MKHLFSALILLIGFLLPAQNNTISKRIVKASTYIDSVRIAQEIPGIAITITKNDSILWSKGFGYANLKDSTLVSPSETQFRVASISKSITALGLGILVDKNLIDLDTSIYRYIPDFPKKKYDFSLRQAAGHIAGIRHYKGREFIINKKLSIVEGLDIFKNDSLNFKPGSKFKYSTYGWNLLSVVVQKASKTEFNQFMQKTVFDPLQMRETTLDVSDSILPNRTQFYIKSNSGEVTIGPKVTNEFKVAGGGFISTSEDLAKFGNEMLEPSVLTTNTRDVLITSLKTNNGKLTNYGIGFFIPSNGRKRFGHNGSGIGASSLMMIYPKEKVVISILTNITKAKVRDIMSRVEAIFMD